MVKIYLAETRGMFAPRSGPMLPEDMRELGQYAAEQARVRVQTRGLSSKESPMPSYTPGYVKQRVKAGKQTGFRDLTRSGRFFASLRVIRASKTAVTYGWSSMYGKTLADVHGQRVAFLPPTQYEESMIQQKFAVFLKRRVPSLRFTRPDKMARKVGR